MFERFTDRARKVMALANQEAQRFNHEYIDTEHILMGLIKSGQGVGWIVLLNLGVDAREVQQQIEKTVQPGPKMTPGKLPQTLAAKNVVHCAVDEHRRFQHDYIGTEHLLLGLIHEEEGLAGQILSVQGLTLEAVRAEIRSVLELSKPPENEG